ncbi:glycosyltransferase [Luminiphilus sp.]|nr:glycosyltransferase [Luminiphilus sp.]
MNRLFVLCENLDTRYGGPAYSVPSLLTGLSRGCDVEFHSIRWHTEESNGLLRNASWTVHPRTGPAKLGMSLPLWRHLWKVVDKADVVHLNNLWNAVALLALLLRLFKGCSLIVSTRGGLQSGALRTGRIRKWVAWAIFQKKCLLSATRVIAASSGEKAAILSKIPDARVEVIENSIDIPDSSSIRCYESRPNRVLYLGRLHEHKRISMLLDLWASRESEFFDWELVFAGPDYGGYLPVIRSLEQHQIHYAGLVTGTEKADLLNSAMLLVLPSKSENFGIVVAEALASAVPVLVTDTTPWGHLCDAGAGLAVAIESFEKQLFRLLRDRYLLSTMSRRARAYACENLGWRESRERYRLLLQAQYSVNSDH